MKFRDAYLDICENFKMKLQSPVNFEPFEPSKDHDSNMYESQIDKEKRLNRKKKLQYSAESMNIVYNINMRPRPHVFLIISYKN